MARSYAKLLLSVWRDPEFRALPAAAQRMYFTLLSQPKLSHAGCIPHQPVLWAKLAPDTTNRDVTGALDWLAEARFVLVDPDTEEVLIRTFIRHDGGAKNPNMRKAIESAVAAIESEALRAVAAAELARASGKPQVTDPDRDPSGRRTERHRERDAESTCSPTPASFTGSQQPPVSSSAIPWPPAGMAPAAAAALDMLIAWKLAQPGVKNPGGLERSLRRDLPGEWGEALAEQIRWKPGITAAALARLVLGMKPSGAFPNRPELDDGTDRYCDTCSNTGWISEPGQPLRECGDCKQPAELAPVTPLRRTPRVS